MDLFWLSWLVLMDNYSKFKVILQTTKRVSWGTTQSSASAHRHLRGEFIELLKQRKTTDFVMTLERGKKKTHKRSRLVQLLWVKGVLYFGDIPLDQQHAGINLNAPEHFNPFKNPVTWKIPFCIHQEPSMQNNGSELWQTTQRWLIHAITKLYRLN